MILKVAIACGGTGGHLFPGVAIGESLLKKGVEVALIVSTKAVDQDATANLKDKFIIKSFPAVGLAGKRYLQFARGLMQSRRQSLEFFKEWQPDAALAMGGFTSAGPIFAARKVGIPNGIHEANVIPGRANRWLAKNSDFALLNFEATRSRLKVARKTDVISCGLPVRSGFFKASPSSAKESFGWDPDSKVLLVTGGSQGARMMNDHVLRFRSKNWSRFQDWKLLHVTGAQDFDRMKEAYRQKGFQGISSIRVEPFLHQMDQALAAASACITRTGASFLGELEVFGVPALLMPYPFAVENHQYWNAVSYTERATGTIFNESNESEAEFDEKLTTILNAGQNPIPRPIVSESKAALLAARYLISRIQEARQGII